MNIRSVCKLLESLLLKRKFHMSFSLNPRVITPYYEVHKKQTDPKRQDPEHFEKLAADLPIDDFYIDALGNLYQERLGAERDVTFRGEDLLIGRSHNEWMPEIDRTAPRLAYQHVDVLKTAPEAVKKIFSVEFGSRKDFVDIWKKTLIDRVRLHGFDNASLEMRIAWMTSLIRHWSLLFEEINNKPRRPTWLTHKIHKFLDMRRKYLRFLRESDMEAFEKILKDLKIAYHVPKPPEQLIEKRRKAWAEAMLDRRLEGEKEARLRAVHDKFIEERKTSEEQINNRLKELEKEISATEKRIKEINFLENGVEEAPKYQPPLIDCISERTIHANLFYRQKAQAKRK